MLSEQEFRTWMAETMFEDMPGEIYKFFQPHLRPDFPRAMVKGWFEKDFPSMPKLMLEQWLDTLERLWSGETEVTGDMVKSRDAVNKRDGMILLQPVPSEVAPNRSGTSDSCGTCGGSREVPNPTPHLVECSGSRNDYKCEICGHRNFLRCPQCNSACSVCDAVLVKKGRWGFYILYKDGSRHWTGLGWAEKPAYRHCLYTETKEEVMKLFHTWHIETCATCGGSKLACKHDDLGYCGNPSHKVPCLDCKPADDNPPPKMPYIPRQRGAGRRQGEGRRIEGTRRLSKRRKERRGDK